MADIITLDTADFKIAAAFKAGYRDGREAVDETSRETAHMRGRGDALADRECSLGDIEGTESASSVTVASDEHAAYAFGWDVGWQDELQDVYRRGYSEGRFSLLVRL